MKKILFFTAIALSATACSSEQTPVPDNSTTTEPTNTTRVIDTPDADVQSCRFCAQPSSVSECNVADGVATTLYWNLPELSGQTINIFVSDESGVDRIFTEQQPADKGSIETGTWLSPGLKFRLKSETDDVIEEVTIKGVSC